MRASFHAPAPPHTPSFIPAHPPFNFFLFTASPAYNNSNAGSLHGNSAKSAGYGCLMPALIASWRKAWSASPGTTDPLAPFGLCSLSTDDSEGAGDIASFRWAQSGSYGVAPNPRMPNVFIAHGHDLADVWVGCGDHPQTRQCPGCDTADPDHSCLTPFYMGPGIHPRLKKPFGQRLAASALVAAYGWPGPLTGPTLSGCSAPAGALTLHFNASLLAGAPLVLRPYDAARPELSGLTVLVNSTEGVPGSGAWVALNFALGAGSDVRVDLAPLRGAAAQAVKYGWGKNGGAPDSGDVWCCAAGGGAGECAPGACPLYAAAPTAPFGGHPANPFIAQIKGGACVCPAPQVCDATR